MVFSDLRKGEPKLEMNSNGRVIAENWLPGDAQIRSRQPACGCD